MLAIFRSLPRSHKAAIIVSLGLSAYLFYESAQSLVGGKERLRTLLASSVTFLAEDAEKILKKMESGEQSSNSEVSQLAKKRLSSDLADCRDFLNSNRLSIAVDRMAREPYGTISLLLSIALGILMVLFALAMLFRREATIRLTWALYVLGAASVVLDLSLEPYWMEPFPAGMRKGQWFQDSFIIGCALAYAFLLYRTVLRRQGSNPRIESRKMQP